VAVAHLLVDDAMVGPGGGERELHMAMGIYGVQPNALPTAAQYVALGHVHKNQEVRCGTKAAYSGSLLQLDFGERQQDKYVNLVEIHARQPAQVTQLPITAGRKLSDIGSSVKGVNLNQLASYAERGEEAWYRVYVDLDIPVANLAQMVRAELPTAVHVERAKGYVEESAAPETLEHLGPIEMFTRFYESSLGKERTPSAETLDLFRQLLTEEDHAAP
jgi:exonuclease SbcD